MSTRNPIGQAPHTLPNLRGNVVPAGRKSTIQFMAGVIRAPFETGAIAPSSKRLARYIIQVSGANRAQTILELGAGTGVITREILEAKRDDATVLAIERSSEFVTELARQHPDLKIVEGCASRLRSHAQNHGVSEADCIVSGLPWTTLPEALQLQILQEAYHLLRENGVFVTIACFGPHLLPSGRKFRQLLEIVFPSVQRSNIVVRNVPPAFIYRCSK